MAKEPTNGNLKKENRTLKRMLSELQESEEKYRTIVENANDHIAFVAPDGKIIDVNYKFEEMFGYTREETIGKNFMEIRNFDPDTMEVFQEWYDTLTPDTRVGMQEFEAFRKDGTSIYIEVNPKLIVKDGKITAILAIIRDITERKRIESELQRYRDHLEELVKERTLNLEEANTALRVMLETAEEMKTSIEDKMLLNIKEFVLPYVEKLKRSKPNTIQKTYLENLEQNLKEVASSVIRGISSKYLKITPTEIQVANLVKQGKTTKEIAELLNMSTRTIDAHRYSIRSKLGLNKKKENLRTHLLSMGNT